MLAEILSAIQIKGSLDQLFLRTNQQNSLILCLLIEIHKKIKSGSIIFWLGMIKMGVVNLVSGL